MVADWFPLETTRQEEQPRPVRTPPAADPQEGEISSEGMDASVSPTGLPSVAAAVAVAGTAVEGGHAKLVKAMCCPITQVG